MLQKGSTPLHKTDNKEVAELLISKGASIHAVNKVSRILYICTCTYSIHVDLI